MDKAYLSRYLLLFMPATHLTGNIQRHPDFPSKILGNRRDVLVYLPPGYRRSHEAALPGALSCTTARMSSMP